MNKKLQEIFNFIQQSERLDAEQKESLLKAVKDADKELEITAFKLERTEKVKKTTAILLEETIEELEQKRKAVEEQNRELEIEASLERVRAKAMGMTKPEDLLSVAKILYRELRKLGFNEMRNALINIHNDANKTFLNYDYSDEIGKSATLLDYNAHPVMEKQIKQSRIADDAFSEAVFKGKDLEEMKEFRRKYGEKDDPRIKNITALYYYFYSIGNGTIGISTFIQIDENKLSLLKRFRNVFNLAYKRYSDITLAEAQAREAQIELALERIRARTMAMQSSNELKEVVANLFDGMKSLDVDPSVCNIALVDKQTNDTDVWTAHQTDHGILTYKIFIQHFEHPFRAKLLNAFLKEIPFSIHELSGDLKKSYAQYLLEHVDYSNAPEEVTKINEKLADMEGGIVLSAAYMKYGLLIISRSSAISNDESGILQRFAKVFEQTYTRFLDLQKAEAQAKEAEIELSLERIRARSMAMQKSEELKEVIKLVYDQFVYLKINVDHAGFVVDYTPKGDWHFWIADQQEIPSKITHPYFDSVWAHQFNEAKEKGIDFFATNLNFEEKNKFYNELLSFVPGLPDKSKNFYLSCPGLAATTVLFDNVSLYIENFSGTPYTDEENKILMRFGKVFQQTYTRFLDLQKAEFQAREAQIEVALEKIRSRSLAMHNSDEIGFIVEAVFEELKKFGFETIRCGIGIIEDERTKKANIWSTSLQDENYTIQVSGDESLEGHPLLDAIFNSWKNQKELAYILEGEDFINYYNTLAKTNFQLPDNEVTSKINSNKKHYNYLVNFKAGGLYAFRESPFTQEMIQIMRRFAEVFDQAYVRFLDLKKVEAQAREAQIEASLERVRGVAMSMHTSEDLLSICEVSFKEFKKLGFANLRNVIIHILNDEKKYFMDYDYSDHLGGNINNINYNSHPIVENYLEQIKKADDAFAEVIVDGSDLDGWKDFRRSGGQKDDPKLNNIQALYYYLYSIGIGDIGISTLTPIDKSQLSILKRFRNVFDLAYRRYNDIALAEEQARETQIQLALERVRARTMAMHKSEELSETSFVLFEQLKELGEIAEQMSITIYYENEGIAQLYSTIYGSKWEETGNLPFKKHIVLRNIHKAWKEKKKSIVIDLSGEELNDFNNFKMKYSTQYKSERELPQKRWVMHYVFFSKGAISFSTHEPRPQETINLLERFAGVFDLTYTRFLDLKKAEERAREAQIEAALERVRSRSMAMHHTSELQDVINTVHQQFRLLDIDITGGAFIAINEENKNEITCWGAGGTADYVERVQIPFLDRPIYTGLIKCIQKGPGLFTEEFSYKEKIEFFNHLFKRPPYSESSAKHKKEILSRQGGYTRSSFVSKYTCVFIINHHGRKFSEEENNILIRFGKVFEQSYTRFLDLKKAEEQAREAEIEAALERVRSRTMAMQKSNELAETASHLFEQLNSLGIKPYRFNIAIVNQTSEECQLWSTSNEGKVIPLGPLIPLKEHTVFNQMYDGWKQQVSVSVITVKGEDRIEWTKYIMKYVSFNEYKPENIDLERLRNEPAIFSNFFFRQGFIVVHTLEEINDADINIIQRFVNVFEQTYTRFLDLQKAEAQAREAQIEASLERVRSKAMSMHSSEDLALTIDHFFHELKSLNIKPIRCGVGIKDGNLRTVDVTVTSASEKGEDIKLTGKLTLGGHPILDKVYEALQLQAEYFPVLRGEEISEYYQAMNPDIEFPNFSEDDVQYGYYFHYEEGGVFAWTKKELLEEEINIFRKFKSVLSLTYRRYIDLKEAEARSVEAVRQASLDRIRAEIASMRTSEDLNHITPIIWRELKNLEVPFFRCGVYIVDESSEMVQVYLTTPDGKSLGVLNLSFNSNEITGNTVEHWRKKIVYKTHWDKEEFISWTESMMKLGQIKNAETYQGSTTPPESLYLHFVPFAQGMLYVGDVQPLTDEKLQLVKTLAEAFSIAYARYEDFKNLEEAKNKIEITLNELKAAQAQLIHSEKMASLGELTAGIAHEIKNPLNFVNNFSEVSRELLDEMKTEIENKNIDEVIELIEDLKQNLDKINQHGKRADSIVKGMLLHSRGTSGEKTLTDINDLLDQYVNLAYHGMRATNKEFNIAIEKDYDESIEKINVVPQDISRVFLNIINNACYAAFDKKKKSENNFSPILKVSTKKVNNKIEVKIGDNGNGIPADHLEKIFQPFFTTKPSGEGTGLGLSLSYDIVTKVHGGEMKVETKVGEGTEFLILLPSH